LPQLVQAQTYVYITLFDISGTLLESDILLLASDEDVTANNSEGLTGSQYIEEGGLRETEIVSPLALCHVIIPMELTFPAPEAPMSAVN
jgi:hypothetical protein